MPATNSLYIMGADATGVVLGARQAGDALDQYGRRAVGVTNRLTTSSRGLFNNYAQASFAFQDIATVMFMGGGIERALLSASNNFAFMASAGGTIHGALIGVGIVLGSVIVPRVFDWLRNQEAITREALKWQQIAAGINSDARRAANWVGFNQQLRDAQSPEDVQKMIQERIDRAEQLRADLADRERRIADLQSQVDNAVTGMWPFEGGILPNDPRGWQGAMMDALGNVLLLDIPQTANEQFQTEAQKQLDAARAAQEETEKDLNILLNERRAAQEFLVLQNWDLVGALGEQVDLLKEIRRLSEMTPGLAQYGSAEEAQARLNASRAAFDSRIIEQAQQIDPQQDELLRVLGELDGGIDELNAALARGGGLVHVP